MCGGGYVFDYGVQNGGDVVGGLFPVFAHPALLRGAIDGGEVKLFLGSAEVEHQVEHLLLHHVRAAVRFVHLVYDHHGLQPHLYGFLKHEACLGHGTFESIHEQQTAVGHIEYSLHFSAEVGVSRSVDNVDFCPFIVYGNVFGEDSDASLAFQVIVVEYEFAGTLTLSEEVACQQHFIDQGGFPVVHMSYDSYVANIFHKSVLRYFFFKMQN